MAGVSETSKGEQRPNSWLPKTLKKLMAQLTSLDLVFGVTAAILIAVLLLGFRFRALPEYKIGDIAGQDVRAPQDVIYIDKQATAEQRETARERTAALYDLETGAISDLEIRIERAFAAARQTLSDQQIPTKGKLSRSKQKLVLELLEKEVGTTISPKFLPLLLGHRFDVILGRKILTILGSVLRSGIVHDAKLFRQDVGRGIILRDRVTLLERQLSDSSQVRSMDVAKEYLRQQHLEFAELPAPERAELFSFLDTLLFPTLVYNAAETAGRREIAAARVSPVEVQIKKGKVVVRSGEEVTARAEADLEALRSLRRPKSILGRLFGLFLFVAGFLYALWLYLVHHQERYRRIRDNTALVVVTILLVVIVMRLLTALADILSEHVPTGALQDPSNLYFAIPFSSAAVLVTLLADISVGFIVSMMVGILAGLFYGDIYLAVYALLGSLAGLFSIRQYKERSALLKSGLAIGAVNGLAVFGIQLSRQGAVMSSELPTIVAMGVLSGMLASALSSICLPALESMFKITTDIRLLELSNFNAPILRRLSIEAPGTFHHSLMVGTLAEAAAESVGANPLLARVAAYYHDLGKMVKPEYFTENQADGVNKHELHAPSVSCRILAGHVKEGLALAKEAGVPETIRNIIPQHHGTRLMTYFYQLAKESAATQGQEIRDEDFRYPGPKPQSKEAAILMMADCVEAASRTLSNPSVAQIDGMIDRLTAEVLADNQLDECDITIREIRLVRESFLKVLSGTYHRRIDYPGYDFTLHERKPDETRPHNSDIQQPKAMRCSFV